MHDAVGDTGSSPEVIEGLAAVLIAEKYRVLRALGEGATGTVYLCEHLGLDKQVAVKLLHRELADNADLVTRFQREAQTAARLDHPSSVHVMDFGQAKDGTLYLAMEYVQGRDLAELLNDEWPLEDARIVHVMGCVLSALSAAHALGIVHRDLKPENILVRRSDDPSAPDVVKVCDFGIAQLSPVRLARSDRPSASMVTRVTGEGVVVGTPWYMSPEQARAEPLDARSDLYSAGVVLFQLLTRTLPFMAESAVAVAVMHCTMPPPPPSGYGPVHPGLESVCLRALSKTREARFQTAAEMLNALKAAVAVPTPNRLLARRSRPTPIPPVRALPSGDPVTLSSAATELSTPAVRLPAPELGRKRKASLLIAAVSLAVLAIATVPRFLPSQHQPARGPAAHASAVTTNAMGMPPSAAGPESADMSVVSQQSSSEPLESNAALLSGAASINAPETHANAAPVQPSAHTPRAAAAREAARPRKSETSAVPAVVMAQAKLPEEQTTLAPAEKLRAALSAPVLPLDAAKAIEPKAEAPVMPAPAPQPSAAAPAPPSTAAVTAPLPAARQIVAVSKSPDSARVTLLSEKATSGVSKAGLRSALNLAALTRCYQDAVRKGDDVSRGTSVSLDISTNMGGRIVAARVSEGLPHGLRECMEQVARAGQVRGAEAGEVRATFGLKLAR
jgi:serine/threonine protein kinase